MLFISTQFLSNRSQHVMVDSWSKLVNVAGQYFDRVIIPNAHVRAFFDSGEMADRLCR